MARVKDPLAGLARPAPSHSDAHIIDFLNTMAPRDWVVLTGAGVSTDSGLPDYRSPTSPKRTPMTIQMFKAYPANRRHYWARSYLGWPRMSSAKPGPPHKALAKIKPAGIVTQNVDGLHQAAGSHPVIDLHGRLDRVICLTCESLFDRRWVQDELAALNPGFAQSVGIPDHMLETAPDGDVAIDSTAGFTVLACPICGGNLKPDVVFFGDCVPLERNTEAHALAESGRGLLVLGTSLAVLSGLRFVKAAHAAGRPIVIVTDGPTRGDCYATFRSTSRVGDFLGEWISSTLIS